MAAIAYVISISNKVSYKQSIIASQYLIFWVIAYLTGRASYCVSPINNESPTINVKAIYANMNSALIPFQLLNNLQ